MNIKTIIAILGLIPQAISGIKLAVKSFKIWLLNRRKKKINEAETPNDFTTIINK